MLEGLFGLDQSFDVMLHRFFIFSQDFYFG
jgi:hypothetical protein